MHIPVHSPWLPGCIDVTQTILVVLTMAALFPDRPGIFYVYKLSKTIEIMSNRFKSQLEEALIKHNVTILALHKYFEGKTCKIDKKSSDNKDVLK